MKCQDARTLLALDAGGDLSGNDAERLAGHVEACAGCRALREELAASASWMKTFAASAAPAAPPVSEAEYAGIRREVWRRIEAGGGKSASPFARRAVIVATSVFAAALAAVLLVRRAPQESARVPAAGPPATSVALAVTAPSPAPAQPPAVSSAPAVTAPAVQVAASIPRHRSRRPPAVSGESSVERIEFRTGNPNVRIIWLVKKGEEKSSSFGAGRIEEVS